MYQYRTRPSGLTYDLKVENPAWFQPGQRANPAGEFKPGQVPHNYKGDQAGYDALHDWVKRHAVDPGACEHCGHDGSERRLEWANKSHEYRRDLDDWLRLCSTCHGEYDRGHEGAMRERFPEHAEKKMLAKRVRRAA